MKKLKLGFTVVEMITAMAIVGVAASFVIPLAIKSFSKHQAEVVLGRAVEHIIQGNQNMIQLANMNNVQGLTDELGVLIKKDLYPSAAGSEDAEESVLENLAKYVRPYWKLNKDDFSGSYTIRNFNGSNAEDAHNTNISNGTKIDFTKIPATVILYRPEDAEAPENSSSDTGYLVYIDVTGLKNSPNVFGKDIFCFHLINDGSLVALGSSDFIDDEGKDISNGLQFTEQIVKDGFRITYYD